MASDTRGRRWWASIGVGAAICIGCCLAPLLAAIGLAGGGLALLSISWLEPLGFALIVLGVGGVLWSRVRAARCARSSSGTSAGGCGDRSCGCSAADPATDLPMVPGSPR